MRGAGRETRLYVAKVDPHPDVALAALADAQHGVVSLGQLRRAGLSDQAVRKRAARGRLHRVHRGVYAVGRRRLGIEGRFAAGVLACGEGAVLSHRSAAHLLGLLRTAAGPTDVTVPTRCGRVGHERVAIHRSATLTADEVRCVEEIPCTTVARTLLDLADVVGDRPLRAAVEEAERLRVYDDRDMRRALEPAGKRPAARRLARVLADYEEPDAARTELERRALALFARAGLPKPLVNGLVETAAGPLEVDFLWPDRSLVVEADGFRWHSSRRDFENDRERDQLLHAVGLTVLRVTWRQVTGDEAHIVRALRAVA